MVMDPSERVQESPKNPGDRGFGHGDTVTLEVGTQGYDSASYETDDDGTYIPAGSWIRLEGDGTIRIYDDDGSGGSGTTQFDGVIKHKRYVGDDASVHLQGVVRVSNNESEAEAVLNSYDDGDSLVHLG